MTIMLVGKHVGGATARKPFIPRYEDQQQAHIEICDNFKTSIVTIIDIR